MRTFLTIIFILSGICSALATTECLKVNHITHELYWAETDHPKGYIGWESIAETQWGITIKEYKSQGYTFTKYPYKIETAITLLLILSAILIIFLIRRRKMLCKEKAE